MSPATRPCPLEDLIVITAQVGDEYKDGCGSFRFFNFLGIRGGLTGVSP
jgi:hypothetical protein